MILCLTFFFFRRFLFSCKNALASTFQGFTSALWIPCMFSWHQNQKETLRFMEWVYCRCWKWKPWLFPVTLCSESFVELRWKLWSLVVGGCAVKWFVQLNLIWKSLVRNVMRFFFPLKNFSCDFFFYHTGLSVALSLAAVCTEELFRSKLAAISKTCVIKLLHFFIQTIEDYPKDCTWE